MKKESIDLDKKKKLANNSHSYDNIVSKKPYNVFQEKEFFIKDKKDEENVYNLLNSQQQHDCFDEDNNGSNNIISKQREKNYILENRLAIYDLPKRINEEKQIDKILHKNFGKIPD